MTFSKIHALPLSAAAALAAATFAHADPQPSFSLPDVNANSGRTGQMISPRDYREQISVYYFGREW